MKQEQVYNENELTAMLDALNDVIYKLESIYNSSDDRAEILWQLEQLGKIENLLNQLKEENQ